MLLFRYSGSPNPVSGKVQRIHYLAPRLQRLALFETLTPLTGEENEWTEVSDGVFQNRRRSDIFKENRIARDNNPRVFQTLSGGEIYMRKIEEGYLLPIRAQRGNGIR